jgi:hypothetical protein
MTSIYQIKVTLVDIQPPIWRRFQVRGDTTLLGLHQILQDVMGWEDCHLHEFVVGDRRYGMVDLEFDDPDILDECEMTLALIPPRQHGKLIYHYDFGDGWRHKLVVEKILEPESGIDYPICLGGKHHCPPEDCGGVWGYANFLEAIRDREHPEHEEYLEWVGEAFDPEAFDLNLVKKILEGYKRSK